MLRHTVTIRASPTCPSSSMEEQRTFNPLVQGSSPWGGTTSSQLRAYKRMRACVASESLPRICRERAMRIGTMRERSPGKWELVVSAGVNPATGRYHRVVRTVATTWTSASRIFSTCRAKTVCSHPKNNVKPRTSSISPICCRCSGCGQHDSTRETTERCRASPGRRSAVFGEHTPRMSQSSCFSQVTGRLPSTL
jgi:hypothetical protein